MTLQHEERIVDIGSAERAELLAAQIRVLKGNAGDVSGSSPLLQAARLWEGTSARGTRYLPGRLGSVRVVIMPNRDSIEDDTAASHTDNLYFQDGLSTQSLPAELTSFEDRKPRPRQAPRGGLIDDDPVPF